MLRLRLLTAAIAIPVVVCIVWLGGWFAFTGSLAITVLLLAEVYGMVRVRRHRLVTSIGYLLSVAFLCGAFFTRYTLFIDGGALTLAILGSLTWFLFRENQEGNLIDWALSLAIPLYIGWTMSFFLLLRNFGGDLPYYGWPSFLTHFLHTAGAPQVGLWWVLTAVWCVWGYDSGAFFAGKYLGRHKLATRISPGKTWEGVLGGVIVTCIGTSLFTFPLGLSWYQFIPLGILIAMAAQLGDLSESMIKRQIGVKDSGPFFPGHGGLLDRMDSLLFVIATVFYFALILTTGGQIKT